MSDNARRWVGYFVDYSALVIFMAAFFLTGRDIARATWFLVAGSAVALAVGFAVERRLAPIPALAGGAALVFGGLSLFFHDPRVLKVKPTVMNSLFGIGLLVGQAMGKNPLKLFLGDSFEMPPAVWRRLTLNYVGLFFGLAVLNEVIWRTQTDSTWVLFRFPGMMILTLIFSLAHGPLLMKHLKADEKVLPPPVE
jgi:intracellular septation protein